ncbi:MAG: queuosine precursor transporter [Thiomargarita sp.]|nr:queuosine precursor transporter [Thiomargarita sp.]
MLSLFLSYLSDLSLLIQNFFAIHQDWLWLVTVAIDLGIALVLYRMFGKMGLYTVVILNVMLSNLQGPKLTVILGLETSLGVILYSGIYFATDLLSEKYGRREGQRAVLLGFVASVIMILVIYISLLFLPSQMPDHAEFAGNVHDAMTTLFGFAPLFVFGSLFAYLISQSFDVWIFHYFKKETGGKHLWLRNNVSTLSSQALDTVLYGLLVWAPVFGLADAAALAAAKYVFKAIIAVIDTFFIYWARTWNVHDTDWNDHIEVYQPNTQDEDAGDLFIDAWHGKTPLWKVFWIYNIFFGTIILAVLSAITSLMSPITGNFIQFFAIVLSGPYIIWALRSVWKCADNSSQIYKILAKTWVIFVICALMIAWYFLYTY